MRGPMERALGQLVMIGFEGTETTPELRSFIREEGIGGVILFRRNITSKGQLVRLTNRLQEEVGDVPLLVAIDQEGGRVQRLTSAFGAFPSMAEVGRAAAAAGDPGVVLRAGERVAGILKPLGINLNFAPVLDVNTNPFNPVIGDRALGNDADFVAAMGVQYIRGLLGGGVLACGKHFPGHGDTDADSHRELPVLNHTRRRFEVCEWKPFRAAIAEGVPAIMTAHLLAPNLDPHCPASVSHDITSRLLRGELGFTGVVITDDLTMAGIAQRMSVGDAAVKALAAGSDMILVSEDQAKQRDALDAIKRAADDGTIPPERLIESLTCLTSMKNRII